jgi:hypothetical protein
MGVLFFYRLLYEKSEKDFDFLEMVGGGLASEIGS